jgi:type IV pilus biogenesis protein PilP
MMGGPGGEQKTAQKPPPPPDVRMTMSGMQQQITDESKAVKDRLTGLSPETSSRPTQTPGVLRPDEQLKPVDLSSKVSELEEFAQVQRQIKLLKLQNEQAELAMKLWNTTFGPGTAKDYHDGNWPGRAGYLPKDVPLATSGGNTPRVAGPRSDAGGTEVPNDPAKLAEMIGSDFSMISQQGDLGTVSTKDGIKFTARIGKDGGPDMKTVALLSDDRPSDTKRGQAADETAAPAPVQQRRAEAPAPAPAPVAADQPAPQPQAQPRAQQASRTPDPNPVVVEIGGAGGAYKAHLLIPYQGEVFATVGTVLPTGQRVVSINGDGVVVEKDGQRSILSLGQSVPAFRPEVMALMNAKSSQGGNGGGGGFPQLPMGTSMPLGPIGAGGM